VRVRVRTRVRVRDRVKVRVRVRIIPEHVPCGVDRKSMDMLVEGVTCVFQKKYTAVTRVHLKRDFCHLGGCIYPDGDGRVHLSARFFKISAKNLADLDRWMNPRYRVHANESCGVTLKNADKTR
jgi:hypothetical protein